MKNIITSTILLLALLLPALTYAHDFKVDGIYYNRININEVEVTFGRNGYFHYRYSGTVTIPATVTYDGTTYSVTKIGDIAFLRSTGLTSVDIPNSVTEIGHQAFQDCDGLTSIDIPNSVTKIGELAFAWCSGLTNIVVESGNPRYDSRNNCNAIIETASNALIAGCKNTIIPNSVTEIGVWAFYYCDGLTSIDIPNSVTSIGHYAFYDCTGLTSIDIPNSVTAIGDHAFDFCPGLTSIMVESGNPRYDSRNNCNAIIETASNTLIAGCKNTIIPNSVTAIGDDAFCGCTGLTSIDIPNSVTAIGDDAFYNTAWYDNQPDGLVYAGMVAYRYKGTMPSGTNMTFKEGTLGIAVGAFWGCYGLTSIVIPNSVTAIGNLAFACCNGLTSIVVESGNPRYDSRNNCNAIIETANNVLIAGCKNTIIPNSVTSIGDYAFYDCKGLANIVIPNSVTAIGAQAFSGAGLTSIVIPNSVTAIGDFAFSDCTGLTSIDIPNSVTAIGDYAFVWCTGLTSIVVESGNPRYDSRNNCNAIIESASNTLIAGCKNTTIPNSVTAIGDGAFQDCDGLTSIVIPNSVTAIDAGAFEECSGLTSIVIPHSVTEIGDMAFAYCTGLTDVYCYIADPSRVSSGYKQFGLDNSDYSGRTLHVQQGTADAYRADVNWYPYFGQIVEDIFLGDVNHDLEVNIADVNAAINMILEGNGSTAAADVNGDGEINIADINALIDTILNGNM